MPYRDFRRHPLLAPENRPPQWLLIAIAIAIAVVVTFFGGAILYIAEVLKARPLGM